MSDQQIDTRIRRNRAGILPTGIGPKVDLHSEPRSTPRRAVDPEQREDRSPDSPDGCQPIGEACRCSGQCEHDLHRSNGMRDVAQIARGDRLVDATPEALRELAESAMLLSQGAQRAIEMKREATEGDAHAVPAASG